MSSTPCGSLIQYPSFLMLMPLHRKALLTEEIMQVLPMLDRDNAIICCMRKKHRCYHHRDGVDAARPRTEG